MSNFNLNNKSLNFDNPGSWNGRNDIKKEHKSIHTKRIERVGTQLLTDMHRDQNMFEDRMSNNINYLAKGVNIMAKKGLYANINARRRAGTSRPKSKSTISPKAYANMKAGFPKKKKRK